jgi:hypothetical protein
MLVYAGRFTAEARALLLALMQAAMGGLPVAWANFQQEKADVMIAMHSLDAEWLARRATDGAPSNSNVFTAFDADSFI